MPASKRLRACDACHSIKIKCELGSSGRDPPCSRCLRLGKNCSISIPKSQKDRVAELEAQVEFLTKTIELLRTSETAPSLIEESSDAFLTQQTPDRSVEEVEEPAVKDSSTSDQLRDLDSVIAVSVQRILLQKYVNEMSSRFDLLLLHDLHDFDMLRQQKPLLFLAVTCAASDGILQFDQRQHLGKILVNLIVPLAGSKAPKSLELVQALLITSLWYRLPTYHTKVTPWELIHLAVTVATDIGVDIAMGVSPADLPLTHQNVSGAEARVALAVCRMLSSSIFIFLRLDPPVVWSAHDDLVLFMLDSPVDDSEKTRLIAQYVRAERLCGHIATRFEFSNSGRFMDLADSTTKFVMQSLQDQITDWKAQIPLRLHCPALRLWEHAAMVYLHECVLHTPSNKQSFAAPFTAERLSVTDFPKPVVTQDHIDSLVKLRDNAHALIDVFSALDDTTIMSFPALLFASRVNYSTYILVKLYLATTANGNTFGTYMNPGSIMLTKYLQKVIEMRDTIHDIDPHCGTAKILSMSLRFKEWLENYKSTHLHIQERLDLTVFDYNWNNGITDFDPIHVEENGFLNLFPELNSPVTQSWTS